MSFIQSLSKKVKRKTQTVRRKEYDDLRYGDTFNPNENNNNSSGSDKEDQEVKQFQALADINQIRKAAQAKDHINADQQQQQNFQIRTESEEFTITQYKSFQEQVPTNYLDEALQNEYFDTVLEQRPPQHAIPLMQKVKEEVKQSKQHQEKDFDEMFQPYKKSQQQQEKKQEFSPPNSIVKVIPASISNKSLDIYKRDSDDERNSYDEKIQSKNSQQIKDGNFDALSSFESLNNQLDQIESNLNKLEDEEFLQQQQQQDQLQPKSQFIWSPHFNEEEFDQTDFIKLIDFNERSHQEFAKEKLKANSVISLSNFQSQDTSYKVLTKPKDLNIISNKMKREEQFNGTKATSVGISEELLMYGNNDGNLWMFDRESEEQYMSFSEKSKEFVGNAITAIDVHPTRTDYVVLGFMRGQLVLFDVTDPKKSIKVIKDNHKGSQIINVKFCDWKGKNKQAESEIFSHEVSMSANKSMIESIKNEDKQPWMFVSIDDEGKVVISTVSKILIIMNASKLVLVDPFKNKGPKYTSIASRFQEQIYEQGNESDHATIMALGNPDMVHIFLLQPNQYEIVMTLYRPKQYYSKKKSSYQEFKPISPQLCWGFGHTPIFKDKAYSLLAVAWGPLIQLVVLNDIYDHKNPLFAEGYYLLKEDSIRPYKLKTKLMNNEDDEEEDEELFQNDMEKSFINSSLYIESIHFISESTIIVLTRGNEIRVLNTEHFHPEEFYADMERKIKAISEGKQVYVEAEDFKKAEIAEEVIVDSIKPSMFGLRYHQTFKFFKGMGVILQGSSIQTFQHISWVQSLKDYKHDNDIAWINIFARALDFYRGKIKGFMGVPEDKEIRENSLKAELKLMIREFILEAIEKQNTLSTKLNQNSAQFFSSEGNSFLEDSLQDIKEHLKTMDTGQDEKNQNYKTLVRIAIEFCVEIQDCWFLFYDLFLLFQEEKMEDAFVAELEPFIMAGKFLEWEIPNDILQNHLINYYKENSRPENLEKIIINLDFKQCPNLCISELIHYSEQNCLSTAILFLYTQVFERKDNTSCVQVLFSLCDLYKNAQNKGKKEDIQKLKDILPYSTEKYDIEKSQAYIGFKILWVLKLFIQGKKFPYGTIREHKWRVYVLDIVQFIATKKILEMLINIDCEATFTIISMLFYEGKAFDFIKLGRDPKTNNDSESLTHKDILNALKSVCANNENEDIKLQYLFFVSNIANSCNIDYDQNFAYSVVKDLLKHHTDLLLFNQHILERTLSKHKMFRKMSRKGIMNAPDDIKHLIKSENDLINLLQKCEPLNDQQISELIQLATDTTFKQVKVYLLEKKEDYIQCLQLLLDVLKQNEQWSQKYQTDRAFDWIKDKLDLLEKKSSLTPQTKKTYEHFKKEVLENIKQMIMLNVQYTIQLIDDSFDGTHLEVIQSLRKNPQEQLLYLETLLTLKEEIIQNLIREYSLKQTNQEDVKKYLELLKLHLKLCCMYKKEQVLQIVEKIVQHSYYPTEDCLKICQEHHQIEACALLNKKLGKYFESVQQYLQCMLEKVESMEIKNELKFAAGNGISTQLFVSNPTQLPLCTIFDNYFKVVAKICKKNHSDVDIGKEEQIWFIVLDTLFDYKNDPKIRRNYYSQFFQKRITFFANTLLNHIKFQSFLNHVLAKSPYIKFKELQELINDIFFDAKSHQIVLFNANYAIHVNNSVLFRSFQEGNSKGINFRCLKCYQCKKFLDLQFDENEISTEDESQFDHFEEYYYDPYNEHIRIFQCQHTFHIQCLQKLLKIKPLEPDEVKKQRLEKMQCPYCYSQNFEIDEETTNLLKTKAKSGPQNQKVEITQGSEQTNEDQREVNKRKTAYLHRSNTMAQRQIQKLQKRMENFESNMEIEALTVRNFRT